MRVNDYGMCRRPSPELDDFYAYYSVQTCAYLKAKKDGRFDSNAEREAVTRMIGDTWRSLLRSGRLDGLSPSIKLASFKAWPVSFPIFGIDRPERGKILAVDFRRGIKLRGDERCSCGSGLPYMRCCGRTSSARESSCE